MIEKEGEYQIGYQKVNTYTRKPSPKQIVAYFIMILELVFFYAVLLDMLKE